MTFVPGGTLGLSLLIFCLRLGALAVHFCVLLRLWGRTLGPFFDFDGKDSKKAQQKKQKKGVILEGRTCNPATPAQSKHTFLFSYLVWKIAPKSSHLGSILGAILVNKFNFGRNNDPKNASKKEHRPRRKQHPMGSYGELRRAMTKPGGSRRARLVRAFSGQETTV